jgi:hypothetical protein
VRRAPDSRQNHGYDNRRRRYPSIHRIRPLRPQWAGGLAGQQQVSASRVYAVYAGSWLSEARAFIAEDQASLQAIPVWLFASSPLGEENPQPVGEPAQLPEFLAQTNARDHCIFVGKLDRNRLNPGEKLIGKVVRASYGDCQIGSSFYNRQKLDKGCPCFADAA